MFDSTPAVSTDYTVVLVALGAFWVICGIVSNAIWSSKGGAGASAFLAGLLFGPIGVAWSGFAKPGLTEYDSFSRFRRCPGCAEPIFKIATEIGRAHV